MLLIDLLEYQLTVVVALLALAFRLDGVAYLGQILKENAHLVSQVVNYNMAATTLVLASSEEVVGGLGHLGAPVIAQLLL